MSHMHIYIIIIPLNLVDDYYLDDAVLSRTETRKLFLFIISTDIYLRFIISLDYSKKQLSKLLRYWRHSASLKILV